MNPRKLLRALHRDLGFFAVGLTVIYSLSGIAVNHIHQWNPSYVIERENVNLGPLADGPGAAAEVLQKIGDTSNLRSTFRAEGNILKIFTERTVASVDLSTGEAQLERSKPRALIFPMNYLHLNHPKGAWTWVADLFGVVLIFLAISGMFLSKGGWLGVSRRGWILTALGTLLPLAYLFIKL